jgi:Na+/H+ antiporter NhaD/arsenite permease-like protein
MIITLNTSYGNNIINLGEKSHLIIKIILIIFIICYTLIMIEEFIKIKKSKSSIIGATIMWSIIGFFYSNDSQSIINVTIKEILSDYCELLLFLFVALIYINTIIYFGFLDLIKKTFFKNNTSYKKIYWTLCLLSFSLSPIADNLTTSIVISAILFSFNIKDKNFINICCVSIVISSNAGGAFSPFGDITTLMIWQNNILEFKLFFYIFIPSIINFIIPSLIMSTKIPKKEIKFTTCNKDNNYKISIKIALLFIFTIIFTVSIQIFFKLPSTIGMMFGLALLQIFEFFFTKKDFKISDQINKIEWDTLFFFYGIMLCIGALSSIGILNNLSEYIYNNTGYYLCEKYKYIPANIFLGLLSSIIDNIPITFAILKLNPNMNTGDWLLVTLTTGTGGSLLSIGSAAGIAIMGISNGIYTFWSHLKWFWIILLGYIISIISHIYLNNIFFNTMAKSYLKT